MPQIPLILAGALLSIASVLATGALIAPRTRLPWVIRFVTGAAVYSLGVFVLLASSLGYLSAWFILAVLLVGLARQGPQSTEHLPRVSWLYRIVFAIYGLMYAIFAVAPEIQEDAAGYHLRIVSDLVRAHAFSNRVTFYDALPHGLEMLFVPAFAIGAHSAAKLVHFAFLIALVPLVREIARELRLSDRTGTAAAAFLFLAPVSGVAGTCAYTDLGLLGACSAAIYLLLRWRRERTASLLFCAGLNAGFCFAIKLSFGWVLIPGLVFTIVESRRFRDVSLFTAAASCSVVPWLLRDWFLTGNPLAPFLNPWLPNASSTPAVERHLFEMYSAFRPGFSWLNALPSYTVTGGGQGLLGPAFLLLPLAVASVYRKQGRWLLGCSLLLAIPFLADTGTRFLLPSMVPASLALTSILPGPALAALVFIQAVAAAPPVLDLYEKHGEWRLHDIPILAALRIQRETEYLSRTLPKFSVVQMIAANTPPQSRIFACTSLPESYLPREVLIYWQSAIAERITDALHFAWISRKTDARLLSVRFQGRRYRSFRVQPSGGREVRIVETHRTTGGADFLFWPADPVQNMEALSPAGTWQPVNDLVIQSTSPIDLRRDAAAFLRHSGYRYILIPIESDAFAEIGMDMARHPEAWGVEERQRSGNEWLFYIRPDLYGT